MNINTKNKPWKVILLISAVLIGLSSLIYTNILVRDLSAEERKKVELWAKATKKLIDMEVNEADFELLLELIENNNTVPVVLVDNNLDTVSTRNLDPRRLDSQKYMERQLSRMKSEHDPIIISLGEGEPNYLYYRDSTLLSRLFNFPFIQLGVIVLFIAVSYFAFNASRRAEQNQVWVGLTRETAHQLGTPTSSLLAWLELFRMKKADEETLAELEKDIKRLEKIADRFSKIGSRPVLEKRDLRNVVTSSVQYLKSRISGNIEYQITGLEEKPILVDLNPGLFEWVIENICKNAVDAMGGTGMIILSITEHGNKVFVDITDAGKGIPKKLHSTIFKPGYTSKPRGWGLGLSLAKRIIENYHRGKLFVQYSEPGKGTTIRIVMKAAK